jgi:hypothetical protein
MILVIEHTVGYMLKVIKSGIKISAYKDEFNAIRHGDYKSFLQEMKEPIPFMIKYQNGVITNEEGNPNYDCDFEGLSKAGSSLRKFYKDCLKVYGIIIDKDVDDLIYYKVVTFEIAIRMHANNENLLSKTHRTDLEKVIDILCDSKNITDLDKDKIHQARRFLNMVKHFKNQFPSWAEGQKHFLEGYEVLKRHNMLIV